VTPVCLSMQCEAWLEGPNKSRRSIGAWTVHLGTPANVTTLLSNT
jgi:hypothetical protein